MATNAPYETFPALQELDATCHAVFLQRHPSIEVDVDKETALQRLAETHRQTRFSLGFIEPLQQAEQVHGNQVAVVSSPSSHPIPGVDALVTNQSSLCLGIYVADCAAVYLVDPVTRSIGLAHSGKKGTELHIVEKTLQTMQEAFGSSPENMTIQISPCIRPPHYEIDFARQIVEQAKSLGVQRVFDSQIDTAGDLTRYYSYRKERGKTGRMLALLAVLPPA